MKVIALKSHSFAGTLRREGTEYEIGRQSIAATFEKLGFVRIVSRETIEPKPAAASSAKRTYNRRNLTAVQ